MTPDKRLDQIEPVLADVAQKVDRLIESNSRIITEVSKIAGLERAVALTAKGLVNLTLSVDKRFVQVNGRLDNIDGRLDNIDGRLDGINQRFDDIDGRLDGVDQRFDGIDGRLDGIDQRFDGIDGRLDGIGQRFDQLQDDVTDLKSGQQLILQILREKLP